MRKSYRWEQKTPAWLEEQNGEAVTVWLDNVASRAEKTKSSYAEYLRMFCDHTGLSLQEIYDKRLSDIETGDRLQKRSIEREVKKLMALMQEGAYPWGKGPGLDQPMAPSTCRQIHKAVSSFFEIFEDREYELYIKKKDLPQGDSQGSAGVMASQILDMWRLAGLAVLRNRASISFLKDAGIRISDLCRINVGDYREARDRTHVSESGEQFLVFDPIRTKKCGIIASIHVGPETVSDVDLYLSRERPGALDSDPLFAKWRPLVNGVTQEIDSEDPRMTKGAYSTMLSRMAKKLPKNGRKVSAHSLRKFHKTSLEYARLPDSWIKRLEGKKIDVYSRDSDVLPGELLKTYVKAYDILRIHTKPESEKVRETARELTKVREEMQDLTNHSKFLTELVLAMSEDSGETIQEARVRIARLSEIADKRAREA